MSFLQLGRRPAVPLLVIGVALTALDLPFGAATTVLAQEKAVRPLVVVSAASVDRLLEDVETVAVSADRRDLFETLKGLLANVGNFEGADRTKPAGVFVFLSGGLPPKPEPVGFVPVANAETFLKTIAFGPIRTKPVEGKAGRHELVGPEGSAFLQFQGAHAFIAPKGVSLDRTFPDPQTMTAELAAKYDLAARVDLGAIPEGLKSLALGMIRTRAEADQQKAAQKPNATADEIRLQKEMSDTAVEAIESAVKSGKEIVLGLEVNRTSKTATLEARFVTESKGTAPAAAAAPVSGFSADPASPGGLTLSYTVPEKRRAVLRDLADQVEKQALAKAKPDDAALLARLFGPFKATIEAGRLDLAVQFVGSAPGPLTLVGGLRMADAEPFGEVLPELVQKLSSHPQIASAETNAIEAGGVRLHRLTGRSASSNDDRLFGPKPGLLLGSGRDALWFAVAGKANGGEVKDFIAKGAKGSPPDGLHVTFSAGTWVAMSPQAGQEDAKAKLLRDAFIRGKDRFTVDLTGTPTGPLLKVTVEEGYLRLIGLTAAQRVGK